MAAVNMNTLRYAKQFPGIGINAVEPGFTATDLNMFQARRPWSRARKSAVGTAQKGPDGGYFDTSGPIPW
jgi:NAD(P)-dependent dehydrogenase (short-subunit alcohol dehydrogenase family)